MILSISDFSPETFLELFSENDLFLGDIGYWFIECQQIQKYMHTNLTMGQITKNVSSFKKLIRSGIISKFFK